MALPVPPDVRAARDFRVIKGQDEVIRLDRPVDDAVVALIKQGEWVHLNATGKVIKAAGEVAATPMQGAMVNWTRYKQGDTNDGQADAAGLRQVTLIKGEYMAETKLFNAAATYNIGDILVVIDDGAGVGVLTPVTPATVTALQLARAVGKVSLPIASGTLTYESMGAA